MSSWEPIETAKKDRTSRLVWCPDRQNIYCVSWEDGWMIFGSIGKLTEKPTHWMPLPKPPKEILP